MEKEHDIHAEVIEMIKDAIRLNRHWLAYNLLNYYLKKEDVAFFRGEEETEEFCSKNISDYALFNAIHITSVEDAILKIMADQKQMAKDEKINRDSSQGKASRR